VETIYILPIESDNCFYTKSIVRNLNPKMVNNEYRKVETMSFAKEVLSKINEAIDIQVNDEAQSLMIKALCVAESMSGEAISMSTVLGKKIGKANIGFVIEERHKNRMFIYNDILGCALISYDGQIREDGIIVGKWVIGFGLLPGVVMMCELSKENSKIVTDESVKKEDKELHSLQCIVRDWYKDRDWNCPKINKNVVLFLQDTLTDV